MSNDDPFEKLSALCGIEPTYFDVWGERHEATHQTREAVLAAMGLCPTGERSWQDLLREREESGWRRSLPPVLVVPSTLETIPVPIILAADRADRSVDWRLRLEDGAERRGCFDLRHHPASERREIDSRLLERHLVEIGGDLPCGYHQLACETTGETLSLIITPPTAYLPPALANGGRVWGPAVQLYGLRTRHDWGLGDYTDLRQLTEVAAAAGAALVGVNPLHALFPHEPGRASPYSPSSRLFLNILALDPEAFPEFAECREARELLASTPFQESRRALRETALVDYPGVAAIKHRVFELLWRHFRRVHATTGDDRGRAYDAFKRAGGKPLWQHAVYHALREHLMRADPALWGWPVWPAGYRDPESDDVARFAREHEDRIGYYLFLQWEADRQLSRAAARTASAGKPWIGLYLDLAVAGDRVGSEAWSNQGLYADGAQVGAPPDDFSPLGQNWGLPPWRPDALRARRYAPFVALLRASMKHAGALRIDHAMGLMRLYWIPQGLPADQGAYVRYPFNDLLGILALESQRNRCLVIGEDLGTVPAELSASLQAACIQSYRLLMFERDRDDRFKPPRDYPRQAAVAISTHDLPTLRGFWRGRDIEERGGLGLFASPDQERARRERRALDRRRLLEALASEGLVTPDASRLAAAIEDLDEDLARAVHAYLARSPSAVVLVQLDDVLGEIDQVNMPGTTTERPNWRRKLAREIEDWAEDRAWGRLIEIINRERGG